VREEHRTGHFVLRGKGITEERTLKNYFVLLRKGITEERNLKNYFVLLRPRIRFRSFGFCRTPLRFDFLRRWASTVILYSAGSAIGVVDSCATGFSLACRSLAITSWD
jgi:hypothetical protein